MQVHHTIANLPVFTNAALTIGTFDGVHKGHKKIIAELVQEAKNCKGQSVIITFHPHPRKIVNASQPLQLINTLDEKIELLSQTGVDHLVVVPFTHEFAEQTAEQYIEDFLISNFHPHTIIIGYDHHFGKERKGNYKLLEEKEPVYGYRLLEIPKYILDEAAVSSTKIRNALLQSDVETANKLLGYEFFFEGLVVHGDKLGRELGYPTANLNYANVDKIRLGHGVYAAYIHSNGMVKKGMLSIGNRPTLNDSEERVEVNIFDWDAELYEKKIRVTVKKFLRRQEKYASFEELKDQLHRDKENSLACL